ncbi:MAG: hypothetical protein HON04_18785 [Planctomicrobium sp.]|jgi:hypothetical protein|nr:hypothetical protein [Planctomicrobium sp.]
MKKLMLLVAAVAVVGMFAAAPQQAEARPQYLKGFVGQYDISEATELKCGVCHGSKDGKPGGDKKKVSDYGKALGKALGKKNVKGADDIKAALKAAEKGDAGDGKTFGDLLKAGKLPPAAE